MLPCGLVTSALRDFKASRFGSGEFIITTFWAALLGFLFLNILSSWIPCCISLWLHNFWSSVFHTHSMSKLLEYLLQQIPPLEWTWLILAWIVGSLSNRVVFLGYFPKWRGWDHWQGKCCLFGHLSFSDQCLIQFNPSWTSVKETPCEVIRYNHLDCLVLL